MRPGHGPAPAATTADPRPVCDRTSAPRAVCRRDTPETRPRTRHRGKVWLVVSLYNFVMPHKSLRQGRTPCTPAMAIGLTDHVWSYREYIWLTVHTDPVATQQLDERIAQLLTPALQDQSPGRTHTRPAVQAHEKEAAPWPKAA